VEQHPVKVYRPPGDFAPTRTADGSCTLDSPALGEHYHSLHGAATESRHIYIRNGLLALDKPHADILEVGLGTGLNALLTWIASGERGIAVHYTALEPFPVPQDTLRLMGHPTAVGAPQCEAGYWAMMTAANGVQVRPSTLFSFRRSTSTVQEMNVTGAFDLVYFDAFAPEVQPEMWTGDVFERVYKAMRPGGALVTYCVKGTVRRAMQHAGLLVERLPGPPGKRQMLRATRPE
jgi:tRNA U34 5-methylaminomethyl-2-thiouridine-forming methyltransferase MnmC